MQSFVNYLSEGYRGTTISASGLFATFGIETLSPEVLHGIINYLQIVLLLVSITVGVVTFLVKRKKLKE
jgi:hypothetical protein